MADYKPLNITVITYQGGEVENDRLVNYNDPLSRAWLQKHLYWALCNGRSVEIGKPEVMSLLLTEAVE